MCFRLWLQEVYFLSDPTLVSFNTLLDYLSRVVEQPSTTRVVALRNLYATQQSSPFPVTSVYGRMLTYIVARAEEYSMTSQCLISLLYLARNTPDYFIKCVDKNLSILDLRYRTYNAFAPKALPEFVWIGLKS